MLDTNEELVVGRVGVFLHALHTVVHEVAYLLKLVAVAIHQLFVLLLNRLSCQEPHLVDFCVKLLVHVVEEL